MSTTDIAPGTAVWLAWPGSNTGGNREPAIFVRATRAGRVVVRVAMTRQNGDLTGACGSPRTFEASAILGPRDENGAASAVKRWLCPTCNRAVPEAETRAKAGHRWHCRTNPDGTRAMNGPCILISAFPAAQPTSQRDR